MQEITREQEAAIARLAIEHPSVGVTRQDDGTVKVEAGGRTLILDADGNATGVPIESVPVRIPLAMVRSLLGDERVDAAIAQTSAYSHPDHAVGMALAPEVTAALDSLICARLAEEY